MLQKACHHLWLRHGLRDNIVLLLSAKLPPALTALAHRPLSAPMASDPPLDHCRTALRSLSGSREMWRGGSGSLQGCPDVVENFQSHLIRFRRRKEPARLAYCTDRSPQISCSDTGKLCNANISEVGELHLPADAQCRCFKSSRGKHYWNCHQ